MKINCICRHCFKHTKKRKLQKVKCFEPEIVSLNDISYQPKVALWFDTKVTYGDNITNEQKKEIIKFIQDKPNEILKNCCTPELDGMAGDCVDAVLLPFFWKKYVVNIVCKNTDIGLET